MITGHTRFMAGIFLQMYLAHFPRPTHARPRPHKAPPTQSPTHTKPRPHKLHPHQAHPGSESFHNFLTLINAPMLPPPSRRMETPGETYLDDPTSEGALIQPHSRLDGALRSKLYICVAGGG